MPRRRQRIHPRTPDMGPMALNVLSARAASEARADRAHAAVLQRIGDDLDVTFVGYSNGTRTYTINRYDDSE